MTGQREPVDRELLAETVRVYGTAIEYRGQVFNPADVIVHTNGVTDSAKLSAAWQVMLRWQARNRGLETDRLFYEMANALTMGADLTPEQAEYAASRIEREFLGDVEDWQPTGIMPTTPRAQP